MDVLKNKYTLRTLNEEGTVIDGREIEYNPDRLTYGRKVKLREKADVNEYVDYDVAKTEDGQGLRGSNMDFDIKEFRLKEFAKATRDVEIELTQLVWGIEDVNIDRIPARFFGDLMERVKKDDLLDFEKDKQEQERKKKERQEVEILDGSQKKNIETSVTNTKEKNQESESA